MRLLTNKLFVLSLAFSGLMATTFQLARSVQSVTHAMRPEMVTINLPDPPKPLADPPQPEPVDFQE